MCTLGALSASILGPVVSQCIFRLIGAARYCRRCFLLELETLYLDPESVKLRHMNNFDSNSPAGSEYIEDPALLFGGSDKAPVRP